MKKYLALVALVLAGCQTDVEKAVEQAATLKQGCVLMEWESDTDKYFECMPCANGVCQGEFFPWNPVLTDADGCTYYGDGYRENLLCRGCNSCSNPHTMYREVIDTDSVSPRKGSFWHPIGCTQVSDGMCKVQYKNVFESGSIIPSVSYSNPQLGFQIALPKNAKVKEDATRGALITIKAPAIEMIINVGERGFVGDVAAEEEDGLMGGQAAKIYKNDSGYCDGPQPCSKFKLISYQTERNGVPYSIAFYGDTILNQEEKRILESFTFLE